MPEPFTVDHFRAYSRHLVLDSGRDWRVEPFQLEVLADVFAGRPEVWAVVPEGNAKTTLMGALALYHADYQPSASVLMAASSRDQCGVLFDAAAGFVVRSPALKGRFRVFEGYRRIRGERLGSRIQVFAAADRTGDGVIPTLALLDELHRHRDLRLYRLWRGKLDKRDGQLVAISTAGEPGGEFEEIRGRVLGSGKVSVDGCHRRAVTSQMVLHDWSVPTDADIGDVEVVKAANPLKAVTKRKLAAKYASPTMSDPHWRRFVCNQAWRLEVTAVDPLEWDRAGGPGPEVGERVTVGVDLGWKWDTTALVPLAVRSLTERVFGVPAVIVPPRDGSSLRPRVVQDTLRSMHERNPIDLVVMDPQAGGEQMAAWIEEELSIPVRGWGQGPASMATAYERFMEALREGWLSHPRDPVFTAHVLNAQARLLPDGRSRFDRPSDSRSVPHADRRVIDALIAAAMVNAAAGEPSQSSVYERKELLVI